MKGISPPLYNDLLTAQYYIILYSELTGLYIRVRSKRCSATKTTHLRELTSLGLSTPFYSIPRYTN